MAEHGTNPVEERSASRASLHDLLFDRYADAVLVADADGRYVEANLAATTLLGYSRAELLTKRIADVVVNAERAEADFARFSAEGYWRGVVDLRRKDGSTVSVEARATTLETPEGTFGVAIARESGEPLEAALAASEAQFQAIVQSSDDAIFSEDPEGRIRTWNRAAERMFGYSEREILGEHVSILAPPERRDEMHDNFERVWRGEHVPHYETTRMAKDGRRVAVSLSLSPIAAPARPAGGLSGIVAIYRDVSARHEADRRAHVLYELTHLLGRAETYEDVFDAAMDALQRALHTDRTSVLLLDDERIMRFHAWRGLSPGYRAAVEGHDPWAALGDEDPRPIHVPDVAADASLDTVRDAITREGIRALSFIPLVHGELIGKLMLYFDAPTALAEIELQMATSIANQTAFAVGRLRTADELRRAHAQLELITAGSADGITIQDTEGRVVYANEAAARLSGFDSVDAFLEGAAEYVKRWEIVSADGEPFDAAMLPGRRALLGEPHPQLTLHVRDRTTGREYWRDVRAQSTTYADGTRFAINLFHDVTEHRRVEDRLRFQAAVLRAQAEASDEGILVVDAGGRIVSWNARFTDLWSIPAEVMASRSDERAIAAVLDQLVDPEAFVARVEELNADGTSAATDEIELLDGRLFERLSKPLADEAGDHQGRIWFYRDATADRRRGAAQRLLVDAGTALASALDEEVRLDRVLELACEWNADVAALYFAEEVGVRMVGIRFRDDALQPMAEEFMARFSTSGDRAHPAIEAIATDVTIVLNDIPDEPFEQAPGGGPPLELARAVGLTRSIVVPIRSRGAVVGGLSVGLSSRERRYDDLDVETLEELAERIGTTFDNARLYHERDFVARTLQANLLPAAVPDIPGAEIAKEYLPAGEGFDVGGDFYDVFALRDGAWAVVVGDVCGKGATAAALTGVARHTIRAGAMVGGSPASVLSLVNDAILREAPDERFCTVLFARLERRPDGGISVRAASGGHPPPLVLRADGSLEEIDVPGTLLGLFEDPHLTESTFDLAPGDTVVLYTDGVTDEQFEGEEFGEARLHDLLRECAGGSPSEIASRIVTEVAGFNPDPPRDDIAVVVLRATP